MSVIMTENSLFFLPQNTLRQLLEKKEWVEYISLFQNQNMCYLQKGLQEHGPLTEIGRNKTKHNLR